MGFPKDDRHVTGSVGGSTGGVREGYKPEHDSLARAKYASQLEGEAATAKPGRLARIRRALRRLLWEF